MIQISNKYKITPAKGDVYIGRGSPLGNPFVIGKHGNRVEVIKKYAEWIGEQIKADNREICEALNEILERHRSGDSVRLVCFCAPQKCHGEVIRDLIYMKG